LVADTVHAGHCEAATLAIVEVQGSVYGAVPEGIADGKGARRELTATDDISADPAEAREVQHLEPPASVAAVLSRKGRDRTAGIRIDQRESGRADATCKRKFLLAWQIAYVLKGDLAWRNLPPLPWLGIYSLYLDPVDVISEGVV